MDYSFLISSLVDFGATLNLIHTSLVSSLKIPTTSCPSTEVALADGCVLTHSNQIATLRVSILGITTVHDFLVAPIGIHLIILSML